METCLACQGAQALDAYIDALERRIDQDQAACYPDDKEL